MGGFRDGVEVFIYIYIACLRQEVASLPRLLSAYAGHYSVVSYASVRRALVPV